jgi:single-strand DNA-binding protein
MEGRPTEFLRCSIWRQAAEHAGESLTRGMRVIAQGRLKQRSYETSEGEKRTVVELDVDEVGPSLRYATAKVNRSQRASDEAPDDDPWAQHPVGAITG